MVKCVAARGLVQCTASVERRLTTVRGVAGS